MDLFYARVLLQAIRELPCNTLTSSSFSDVPSSIVPVQTYCEDFADLADFY